MENLNIPFQPPQPALVSVIAEKKTNPWMEKCKKTFKVPLYFSIIITLLVAIACILLRPAFLTNEEKQMNWLLLLLLCGLVGCASYFIKTFDW